VPGFRRFFTGLIKNSVEADMRLFHTANHLKVSEEQVPSVYRRFRFAADRLGITQLPDLFLIQSPVLNAYTAGVEQPFVAMTTGCLEMLTDEEQTSVLAHELGHVHASHVLYKTAAVVLSLVAGTAADLTLGVGGLILKPLQLALARWDRAAELTADRAQLLVMRKPEVVLRTLMKMAGASPSVMAELNVKAFIAQAESFEKMRDANMWSKFLVVLQTLDRSHPFSVYRAKEVLEFVTEGAYLEILDGDYPKRSLVNTQPCPRCQKPLAQGTVICPHCAHMEKDTEEPAAAAEGDESLGAKMDKGFDDATRWFKKTFGGGEG
jgi:Zn-dependent protease with chaperone function